MAAKIDHLFHCISIIIVRNECKMPLEPSTSRKVFLWTCDQSVRRTQNTQCHAIVGYYMLGYSLWTLTIMLRFNLTNSEFHFTVLFGCKNALACRFITAQIHLFALHRIASALSNDQPYIECLPIDRQLLISYKWNLYFNISYRGIPKLKILNTNLISWSFLFFPIQSSSMCHVWIIIVSNAMITRNQRIWPIRLSWSC